MLAGVPENEGAKQEKFRLRRGLSAFEECKILLSKYLENNGRDAILVAAAELQNLYVKF